MERRDGSRAVWAGPTRTRRSVPWRRPRARRGMAAALLGVAGWVTVTSLGPAEEPTREVLVAAHDLPAGERLTAEDVRMAVLPADVLPAGFVTTTASVHGASTAGPVRAGEVLTDARLLTPELLRGLPPGLGLLLVPLTEPALLGAARPGSRVDLLSSVDGQVLAENVLVVAAAPARPAELTSEGASSGVFAAVSERQARTLAPALDPVLPGAGVILVVRAPDAEAQQS